MNDSPHVDERYTHSYLVILFFSDPILRGRQPIKTILVRRMG